MLDRLKEIEETGLKALETVRDQAGLEAWRVANIGRSSPLMTVFGELGRLSKEERPAVGQAANQVKVRLEAALAEILQVQGAFQRELETAQDPARMIELESSLASSQHTRETLAGDLNEARAIRRVFGDHAGKLETALDTVARLTAQKSIDTLIAAMALAIVHRSGVTP